MKLITVIFLLSTIIAQEMLVPGHSNDSQNCVICHIQWHKNSKDEKQLVPDMDLSLIIDGQAAHVSNEKMCLSCHDGYVEDSREAFLSKNHHSFDTNKAVETSLPLDNNENIYCGTCHTVHALPAIEPGSFAPFLREQISESQLCVNCHKDHQDNPRSHPVQISLDEKIPAPLAHKLVDNNRLECVNCHHTHGKYSITDNWTPLCEMCHQDKLAIIDSDHDLRQEHPNLKNTKSYSITETGVCSGCHVVHNANSDHLWAVARTGSVDDPAAYCTNCHSAGMPGEKMTYQQAGHPMNVKIQESADSKIAEVGDTLTCFNCHDVHKWSVNPEMQLTAVNEEGNGFTSFLKLPDDQFGKLCINCHSKESDILESDHSARREGMQQFLAQNNSGSGQCSICHNTHESELTDGYSEKEFSPTTSLCIDCHDNPDFQDIQQIGSKNHPVAVEIDSTWGMPGYYSDGKFLMGCETCHDPHKWGTPISAIGNYNLAGNETNSFLNIKNFPQPTLCLTCHNNKKIILGNDHDLSKDSKETISACSFCHSSHNALTDHGILNVFSDPPEIIKSDETLCQGEQIAQTTTFGEKVCLTCHRENGSAKEKASKSAWHPMKYRSVSVSGRFSSTTQDYPLHNLEDHSDETGYLDCITCHNPHKWSYKNELCSNLATNEEGNYETSFLRNPSYKTLCIDCHEKETIWRYIYYHDKDKRTKF